MGTSNKREYIHNFFINMTMHGGASLASFTDTISESKAMFVLCTDMRSFEDHVTIFHRHLYPYLIMLFVRRESLF